MTPHPPSPLCVLPLHVCSWVPLSDPMPADIQRALDTAALGAYGCTLVYIDVCMMMVMATSSTWCIYMYVYIESVYDDDIRYPRVKPVVMLCVTMDQC